MEPGTRLSRRSLLATGGVAAAGLVGLGENAAGAQTPQRSQRAVRLAHLTDIHLQPERAAAEGLAQCLAHVQSLADKPDLIVTGGDLIMDGYDAEEARTKLQWELFTQTMRDHCSLRVEHTLGNHDIWGWQKERSKTSGSEPRWGKEWACEVLTMRRRYHSYDVSNWHLVHLDSTFAHPTYQYGYLGKLDDEQIDWLKSDLAAVKPGMHTLIVSHIPILSITPFVGEADDGFWIKSPGSEMHCDSQAVRTILESAGNVRACISGHMHRIDELTFRGIRYFCNGAVCGSWWKGPEHEAREGYALLDLFEDGSVECAYTPFDWKARE
jgi:3',5'-cyclic AMP phosphodiesterase CpdA